MVGMKMCEKNAVQLREWKSILERSFRRSRTDIHQVHLAPGNDGRAGSRAIGIQKRRARATQNDVDRIVDQPRRPIPFGNHVDVALHHRVLNRATPECPRDQYDEQADQNSISIG